MTEVLRRSVRLKQSKNLTRDVAINKHTVERLNDSEDDINLADMKAAVTRKRPPKRKFGEDDAKVVKPKRVHERDFGKKAGGEEKKGALKVEKRNVSKKKANKNAEKTSKPVLKTSKQLPVKRPASRPDKSSSALPSTAKQAATASRIRRTSGVSTAFTTSGSEDEWEEVEDINVDEGMEEDPKNRTVEVTIEAPKKVESEESKWAKFIRQQVNRKIRERQINCHKMHLLCYIAHLRVWVRTLTRHEVLASLCLSLIPEGYVAAAELAFDVPTAERFLKWFRSAFEVAKENYFAKNGLCSSQAERLEVLVGDRVYEDDKDLASILFLMVFALRQSTRLCLSCHPIPLKDIKKLLPKDSSEAASTKYQVISKASSSIKQEVKDEKTGIESDDNWSDEEHGEEKKKSRKVKMKKGESRKGTKEMSKIRPVCNYWVEYWDTDTDQWICLNPLTGSVDMPDTIEPNVTPPMHYVLAVDDKLALRDLTARYAQRFLSIDVRRLRVEQDWWDATMKLYRSKNRKRERMEDVSIHNCLLSRPKPSTVAEYKGHPLYVLEKDVLKFEAIYPKDQEPLGQIRGLNIYPRSSLHHLEGSLNWMKHARMIKPGEKPIKIVKARPDHKVPPELRGERTLELYGYWQTEPYVPPKVVDGHIPRNEYGNIYMYKKSMLPEGCVHLRLDGIVAVARKLNVEHVPAVVGWEFHKCGNHPIIEGCVVLKEDEQALRKAWKEYHEKKKVAAEKRRHERARKNWRRLVKGVITMKKVRKRFLMSERSMKADEKLEDKIEEAEAIGGTPIEDDLAHAWPRTAYCLPETSKNE